MAEQRETEEIEQLVEGDRSYNYFERTRRVDPRVLTCRTKLQSLRRKLNKEINKQLLIRNGAENLYKATCDRKIQETVAVELRFVNSNLQLLKNQLSELNSSLHYYQCESDDYLPMISVGLKETKDVDFKESFQDFILEHYSENDTKYKYAIRSFGAYRKAARSPTRNQNGVKALYQYYNLLEPVERRFFPPDRNMGIRFEWFDSLTGIPSAQKKVAFEKACVLFNIAALNTQIGTRQDRRTGEGVELAVDNFLQAAGVFHYIMENFSNTPCTDLMPEILRVFKDLMLAQARECLLEKTLQSHDFDEIICLEIAQEFSEMAAMYEKIGKAVIQDKIDEYFPESWGKLVIIKREYWCALAHRSVAKALLKLSDSTTKIKGHIQKTLDFIHVEEEDNPLCIEIRVPSTQQEAKLLGMTHLKRSVQLFEECLRLYKLCSCLHSISSLRNKLQADYDDTLNCYTELEEEDDFQDILDPPKIQGSTKLQLTLSPPCFSRFKIEDLFHDLGPLNTFCAKRYWSAPRQIILRKQKNRSLGFSIQGDSPVSVAAVDFGSPSKEAGLKAGDYIVGVNGIDTKWQNRNELASLIQSSGGEVTLRVVSPINKSAHSNLLRYSNSVSKQSVLNSKNSLTQKRRFSWDFSRLRNTKGKAKSVSFENLFAQ